MIEVQNKKVTDWVAECAAMTKPEEIVWIDGSEAQLEAIRALAVETGEMIKLNEEKLPGCYYYRTDPKDVARDEKRTVICTTEEKMPVLPTTGFRRTKCMQKCVSFLTDP